MKWKHSLFPFLVYSVTFKDKDKNDVLVYLLLKPQRLMKSSITKYYK